MAGNTPLLVVLLMSVLVWAVDSSLKVQVEVENSEEDVTAHPEAQHTDPGHLDHGIHLASWRWAEFSSPLLFTGMLIFACVLKILFHHIHFLEKVLPESCVLIVVGSVCGLFIDKVLLHHTTEKRFEEFPKFTASLFFNILLPPIIFDSAMSLYNKEFLSTFVSVVVFAVFGTLFNVFTVGLSLYGVSASGLIGDFETFNSATNQTERPSLQPVQCLVFSSLISAVDPVAVLAIFEQIHVNIGLYFLVFGESLFNDGVTVVLYNTMITLLDIEAVGPEDIIMATLSFFTVVFGGAMVGFLNGLLVSFITTFTKEVRVVEPLIIFSTAYTAFLFAELFHWSGIISIIAYGITAKRYALQNISTTSYTTVKCATKTLASASDCIIFLFLGLVLIEEEHYFHTGFIISTILFCLVFRFASTFLFSFLVNFGRMEKISYKEQFIMAYGGLRGAVGFSLAMVIREEAWYRELFLTTALIMVFFTVFLQGGTIKFLVKALDIKLQQKNVPRMTEDIQVRVMEEVAEGIVAVCGKNKTQGVVMKNVSAVDQFMKRKLVVDDSKHKLQKTFEKIALDEHYSNLYAPRLLVDKTEKTIKQTDIPVIQVNSKDAKKLFQNAVRSTNVIKAMREGKDRNSDVLEQVEKRRDYNRKISRMVQDDQYREESIIGGNDSKARNGWKQISSNAKVLKAQYDEIQNRKKSVAPDSTSDEEKSKLLSPNIPETQTEEDLSRLTQISHLDDVFL